MTGFVISIICLRYGMISSGSTLDVTALHFFRRCYAPEKDDEVEESNMSADRYCYYFKNMTIRNNMFSVCLERLSDIARRFFYGQCACNVVSMSNYTEIKESVCELLETLADECEYYRVIVINWRKMVKCGTCYCTHYITIMYTRCYKRCCPYSAKKQGKAKL